MSWPRAASRQFVLMWFGIAVLVIKPSFASAQGYDFEFDTASIDRFSVIVIEDFADATQPRSDNPRRLAEYREVAMISRRYFVDRLAEELRATQRFDDVLRGPHDGQALRVSGKITEFVEGRAMARLFVGLGVGSTRFSAEITLIDNESEEMLGTIIVDKDSWILGGPIASFQNIHQFMRTAARRIARKLSTTDSDGRARFDGKFQNASGTTENIADSTNRPSF